MKEPRTVRIDPPAVLLGDCPEPEFTGNTNEDLAEWAIETKRALQVCRAKVNTIRFYLKVLETNDET